MSTTQHLEGSHNTFCKTKAARCSLWKQNLEILYESIYSFCWVLTNCKFLFFQVYFFHWGLHLERSASRVRKHAHHNHCHFSANYFVQTRSKVKFPLISHSSLLWLFVKRIFSFLFLSNSRDIVRNAVNASEHDAVIFTGSGCTGAVHKLINALNFGQPPVSTFYSLFRRYFAGSGMSNLPGQIYLWKTMFSQLWPPSINVTKDMSSE